MAKGKHTGVKIAGTIGAVLLLGLGGAYLALRGPTIPFEKLEQAWATDKSHYVDLAGDVRIHYREDGSKDAPVLVLVHGYGDSHFTWEGWTPILSQTYRVISVDLPGHGLSRAPVDYALNPDALADLVAEVATKVGAERFAIAGNSLGGGVSWRTAVRHPERVEALILVDAAGWPPSKPLTESPSLAFRVLSHPWGREFLKKIDNKPLIRQGLKGQVGDPEVITDAFIDRWAVLQRAPFHRDILLNANIGANATATPEVISTIETPTLILWGEVDPLITKDAGEKFAEHIAGSKLIIYPKVGHLPQVEIPEESAKDVADFLGGLVKKDAAPSEKPAKTA
ncbi:MAG: alpha/beta hydrolase [Asticcacaulis sp.]